MNPKHTLHTSPHRAAQAPDARGALLRDRDFRFLISGAFLSMLGDQFTLIGLPWLVLQMSGDTVMLGTVLALVSVPRALFILVGGALVDRHSPKRVLMITKYVNLALLALLAALVLTGALAMWMVYLLALGIGLATAFSIPAGTAMTPHVVSPQQLQAANGISLALRQFTMFLGPLLAGLLIALFGPDGSAPGSQERALPGTTGIGLAFALDAMSFAISAWTLAKVRTRTTGVTGTSGAGAPPTAAVLSSVWEGLCHFWRDHELRTCFVYWSAVALFIMGPIHIAIPVLTSSQPQLGAAAFGTIVSAHGAGTLVGMVASGALPRPRLASLGLTIVVFDAVIGLLFIPMGWITATWQGAALMLLIGLLGGFMQVRVFTWLQRRVPPALLGRAMGMFMFIFMGLAPISAAVTGWVMTAVTLGQLFATSGALLVALAALALVLTPLRRVTDAPPGAARGD